MSQSRPHDPGVPSWNQLLQLVRDTPIFKLSSGSSLDQTKEKTWDIFCTPESVGSKASAGLGIRVEIGTLRMDEAVAGRPDSRGVNGNRAGFCLVETEIAKRHHLLSLPSRSCFLVERGEITPGREQNSHNSEGIKKGGDDVAAIWQGFLEEVRFNLQVLLVPPFL